MFILKWNISFIDLMNIHTLCAGLKMVYKVEMSLSELGSCGWEEMTVGTGAVGTTGRRERRPVI